MICKKKSHLDEKLVTSTRVAPACHKYRKSMCSSEDPAQPKIN